MTTAVLEKAVYPEGSEYTPVGWTEPTESTFSLVIPLKARTRKRKEAVRAKRPLDISLIQTPDMQWVADEKVTLQFGVGAAPKDAIVDLMETLVEYRDVLHARRYRLAPYLLEHLTWLESALG